MDKINIKKELVIAIAGNPNSGKTTFFNSVTGSKQHVGNWPGVTVEKKEGYITYNNEDIKIIDLPGTYSLGAFSEDERVARDYIINHKSDVIVNIVDASNLERNLYLTMQLLEMGANIVLALNMYDEAKAKNIEIDIEKLSQILDVPVVPLVATKNKGVEEVIEAAALSFGKKREPLKIKYCREIENSIKEIAEFVGGKNIIPREDIRWISLKLLEGSNLEEFYDSDNETEIFKEYIEEERRKLYEKLENIYRDDITSEVAEKRYGVITGLSKEVIKRHTLPEEKKKISDRIDMIVTNRYLGIPLFLLAMWAVFQFTFILGDPLIGIIQNVFDFIGKAAGLFLDRIGAPEYLISLVIDGIIGGAGSVLVFIPNIFLLFFAISLLEDSGYMARAAYIMDRFMHVLGLHGKSFIPLIIGFGCNVPAILAARTLENKKDRIITILISPLISCSARFPVYVLFVGAFFPDNKGLVIFSLYLLGIILAVLSGMIFKRFLFKGETSHFVMELPPYRIPTLKSTLIHMTDRGSAFVKKAGTLIVAAVILIWTLSSLPSGVEYAGKDSIIGQIGQFIAPVFEPAGFGNWQAAVSLLFGVMAKEVVVGTLGTLYGAGGDSLTQIIAGIWTPLSAYAFMVMTLLYIPCAAVIATIKKETNSIRWTLFSVSYSLVLGWTMAVLVYQLGNLLGFV